MTVHAGTFRIYHLPHDVLCGVPLEGIENSPTFRSPSEGQSILSTVLDATTFMYHAIVDVVTFMADLAESIVTFAIEWIGSISSTVSQGIQRAAEAIVNGFNAFVDWAAAFIQDAVSTILSPLVEMIQGACEGYCSRVAAACAMMVMDAESGTVSDASAHALADAVFGDLFLTLFGATAMVIAALTVASLITGPAGLITSLVTSSIVTIIVVTALSAAIAVIDYVFDVDDALSDTVIGLLEWSGTEVEDDDLLMTLLDGVITMFDLIGIGCIMVCPGMPDVLMHVGTDLALSVVGLMLAVYTMGVVDDTVALAIDFVALCLSAGAMLYCIKDLVGLEDMISSSINSSPKCVLALTTVISFCGCAKSTWDVGEYFND